MRIEIAENRDHRALILQICPSKPFLHATIAKCFSVRAKALALQHVHHTAVHSEHNVHSANSVHSVHSVKPGCKINGNCCRSREGGSRAGCKDSCHLLLCLSAAAAATAASLPLCSLSVASAAAAASLPLCSLCSSSSCFSASLQPLQPLQLL